MDPALARLVVDESCRTGRASDGQGEFYDPRSGFLRCQTNDPAFAKLVAQYGAALAPTAMHGARTTGFGGFKVSLEMAYTTIDPEAHYWQQGTQGPPDESTNKSSVSNINPDDVLQLYSIKMTKGFPFGLELSGIFGHLANTSMISGGADVRLALFEGFRADIPGYFPDLGAGGGVRTMTGTSEMRITVASVDAQLSKPIPIAGTVVIEPHVGYQWLHIWGDSGLVDLTPNTDAVGLCGYQGDNTPATPDAGEEFYDGQPTCTGSSADFNNTVVFDAIEINRHRIHFGSSVRYQMVHLGLHVLTDVVPVVDANNDVESTIPDPSDPTGGRTLTVNPFSNDERTEGNDEVGTQWTIAVEVGAVF